MPDPCDALQQILDHPPLADAGIDHDVLRERLDAISGIDVCILEGLRRAGVEGDWRNYEAYLWAAFLRPRPDMTPVLIEALRRRDERAPNEDILDLLTILEDAEAFDVLKQTLAWDPEWDEAHAIGVKAVYALGGIPQAEPVLREAAASGRLEVREAAKAVLEHRFSSTTSQTPNGPGS
ncbi:hypothetical protein O7635_09135 [Asanoa sp. WMMD1127]|uniref:hypothetical protein n=1 Tax=Asanoa sp. WMMD1127 TaxID=3016107 RepID=UPI0024166401|nr:hypothetical protein [Asanoa sp. WMMD1127]MDG4822017.1 hypothetical protein [Asanoa sp. WMMD1127]